MLAALFDRALRAWAGNVAVMDVTGGAQQLVADAHRMIGAPFAVVAHADTVVRLCTGFAARDAEHPEPAMARTAAVL